MPIAYLGIGSNLGDRSRFMEQAKELLSRSSKVRFLRSAPIYETEPVGGTPSQGKFLNTVWEIETDLTAEELLQVLHHIEHRLGRVRTVLNAPRVIDLDILFYGDCVIGWELGTGRRPARGHPALFQTSAECPRAGRLRVHRLVIPHPRLHERWFVLKPLWDLRADLIHPVFKKSVCELLDEVDENH